MAIETKELLTFLNLGFTESEIDSLDLNKVKDKFTETYISQKKLGEKVGELTGKLGTRYKQLLQENGIDFVNSDLEGKQFEDILALGINKFKGKYSSEIDELKSKLGTGTEKQDEALLKKIAKLESQIAEETGKYTTLQSEYENFKTESTNKFSQYKLENKLNEIHSKKIQWTSNIPEVAKKGYFATLKENYKVELDANDNVVVKDKDGSPIPNPAVNNTFKTYEDILQEVGIKEGTWPINNHAARQPSQSTATQPAETTTTAATQPNRTINTALRR